jgi:hypothetical protein
VGYSNDVIISNNVTVGYLDRAIGVSVSGIKVNNDDHVAVVGNSIAEKETHGIEVGGSRQVTIMANTIRSVMSAGIQVWNQPDGTNSTYVVISGNQIYDACQGISIEALNIPGSETWLATIKGNIVERSARGLRIFTNGSVNRATRFVVIGNTFLANGYLFSTRCIWPSGGGVAVEVNGSVASNFPNWVSAVGNMYVGPAMWNVGPNALFNQNLSIDP